LIDGRGRRRELRLGIGKERTMDQELFEEGLRKRREVLGAAYVDAALARADAFSRPWQEFMTQYCWGALWGRPGLPRKTRSMLNLAMLVALNRPDEFKVHVRGALGNGVSREEIGEILLQTAVYAGVPAANAAFKDAREVFVEIDREAAS
jgi:4-carboxymuconolactone decarboxylase